jgi:hypothetical protein
MYSKYAIGKSQHTVKQYVGELHSMLECHLLTYCTQLSQKDDLAV